MQRAPKIDADQETRPRGARGQTANADAPPAPDIIRTALVVDDDLAIARLVGRVLELNGWHTLVADAPRSALVLSRRATIDLLVTDFEMPGMNGLDLAAQLWRRHVDLPVVVVSGWPDVTRLVAGPQLAFVPKPLDLSLLISRINALVAPPAVQAAVPFAFGEPSVATS